MKRTKLTFPIENIADFKARMLNWVKKTFVVDDAENSTQTICYLDSNQHQDKYGKFEALLAIGSIKELKMNTPGCLDALQGFHEETQDWLLGYLSYDLKNEIEDISSSNEDLQQAPELFFFQPERLLVLRDNECEFHYPKGMEDVVHQDLVSIERQSAIIERQKININIRQALSRTDYIAAVKGILEHIQLGDIYEMNFCQSFYADNVQLSPIEVFQKLNDIARSPFAAFCQFDDHHILSASPERYIQRTGEKLISQPIKGTAKRLKNKALDRAISLRLQNDPKERAENIMITDLVRNDLARTAEKGSVKVEELCGLYSFRTVHQLITTISSRIRKGTTLNEILKTTFPMGSMTGAPKLSAMEIIEAFEHNKRGIYSGSIGYISPQGDLDLNVVIRSILYNKKLQQLSLQVGSAITYQSDPQQEYEECLLKAEALLKALE